MATKNEILSLAAAHIEKGWCRGENAKTKNGEATNPWSEDAQKWCVLGSLDAAIEELGLLTSGHQLLGHNNPVTFNDCEAKSKKDILAILSAATE